MARLNELYDINIRLLYDAPLRTVISLERGELVSAESSTDLSYAIKEAWPLLSVR